MFIRLCLTGSPSGRVTVWQGNSEREKAGHEPVSDAESGQQEPGESEPDKSGSDESGAGESALAGLRVIALESRRASETERLIRRHGGEPLVSPSMREVPILDSPELTRFVQDLLTGQIDIVVFMTGVGLRMLVEVAARQTDRQRFLDSLSDITTVARGPKPVAELRKWGLRPSLVVPKPNTWRELLDTLDRHAPLLQRTVALQEYGNPNPSLVAGLEARGARVVPLRVYQYALPEDTGPLRQNVERLAAGQADVLLITSAHQVTNLLEVARQLRAVSQLRRSLANMVVASIGPTTSESLRRHDLPVDLEPTHAKLGHLVAETARRAADLLHAKRPVAARGRPATPSAAGPADKPRWYDGPFMKACRREPTEVTPVWLMRQAGRYMAEYREIRAKVGFLELCKNPQLCSEVMVTAVERLGVDAAIIFSDLLPILEPMGLQLEYAKGDGPVIHNPIRSAADVERVRELESLERLQFVFDTVRQTRHDLPEHLPLIGFAGAPFTLASYMIEGGASRNYLHTKRLMYQDEGAWAALMQRTARSVARYLTAQIDAGAQCVQLFDSWAGCLGSDDYRRYVLPYVQAIIDRLPPGVPVINFATGNPALLGDLARGGAGVIGIDWRIRLDDAWRVVGYDHAVQGNLDPCVLLTNQERIWQEAARVLGQAAGRPGHIFNLGHGILKQTPVENAIELVRAVHELSRSG